MNVKSTMKVRAPAWAAGTPPETGASSISGFSVKPTCIKIN